MYPIYSAWVLDATTLLPNANLKGQQVQVVERNTTTPYPIFDEASDPIPSSLVTVTQAASTPTVYIDTEEPETVYLDWYDAGSGARGPIWFEEVSRQSAVAAHTAAEAAAASAASLAVGVVRSIDGQVPDANGALNGVVGSGSGVLPLPPLPAAPPEGTPAFTLIARSAAVGPSSQLEVVEETATTFTSASGAEAPLALPSGIADGDLLVAVVTHQNTSSVWTAPAGWTLLQSLDTSNSDFRATEIWALAVDGTAPPSGTQTFTNNTSGRLCAAMFRVRSADTTDPLLVGGAIGSRPDNTYTVPALVGAGGGLVLSVTNGQKASGDPAPQPLAFSNSLVPFVSLICAPSGSGAQTFLDIAWENTTVDFAEHTVTTAGASITAMGSQVLALREAA